MASAESLPVFPGARGFGSKTVAGSGRQLSSPKTKVVKVENLNPSGPGSLRRCISLREPRVCVFEVSGVLDITEDLVIEHPYISIAGQTAPTPGVLVLGAGIKVNTHDVLIEHLEIRPGDRPLGPSPISRDGITLGIDRETYNVVLSHLSVSWSIDENISTSAGLVRDVSIRNSIIAEGLANSDHPKGRHSKGVLIGNGSKNVSLYGSFLAHNFDRNIRIKAASSVEFLNNLIYHWGGKSSWNTTNITDSEQSSGPTFLHYASNVFVPGEGSPREIPLYGKPVHPGSRVFVGKNRGPLGLFDFRTRSKLLRLPASPHMVGAPVFKGSGVLIQPLDRVEEVVLAKAGSRPAKRNEIDRRLIRSFRKTQGEFIDCIIGCERSVGAWPKRKFATHSLSVPASPMERLGSGYTRLEQWLHSYRQRVEQS